MNRSRKAPQIAALTRQKHLPSPSSGFEIEQCSAAHHIERDRDVVMRDEPGAVDLAKAGGHPMIGPSAVLKRAADAI
jgi:hypothetical protein